MEIIESNQSSYRLLHKSLWPQDCQYTCQCLKVIFLNQIAYKSLSYCTYHFHLFQSTLQVFLFLDHCRRTIVFCSQEKLCGCTI